MKYLFGPIRSRRLGISLGVDLLPFKTCTMNCLYCECGATTVHTVKVMEYFPTHDVITELDRFLADSPELDIITFAGSGEPTLHEGIGIIIAFIKGKYPQYKVAVLTNGSLLWMKDVRAGILDADIIVPSLDAATDSVMRRINRPVQDITADKVIGGLVKLREEYRGEIRLEIFIVPGINDTPEELALIREAALRIRPDIIQLNTLDRPGTDSSLRPASREDLEKIMEMMKPLNTVIIGAPAGKRTAALTPEAGVLLETIRRRPSTMEDLTEGLGLRESEAGRYIKELVDGGVIEERTGERGRFYVLKN
jgi:wyosine [tRNA(Phe)-imidazoG37] synthetase (radical SAM superfamily)